MATRCPERTARSISLRARDFVSQFRMGSSPRRLHSSVFGPRGVEDALDEAERLAADIHDRHNLVDARAVRPRLALSLGDTEAAISATDEPPYGVIDAMRAEYVATRALALACAGQIAEAEYQLDTLTEVSTQPDASGLSVTTRAVIAARQRDLATVGDQLHKLMRLGILIRSLSRSADRQSFRPRSKNSMIRA